MKTGNIVLFMLICAMLGSCKSSAQTNGGKKNVDTFTKIASSAGIDVNFTQGNSHTVEIETDAENLDKIEIVVRNGSLELKRKQGVQFKRNSRITAYVSAKTLEAIAMSGGADFYAKALTNDNTLSIAASGGADIEIDKLNTNICNIAISGGSDADIKQLKTKSLKLAASGGSDAEIHLDNADNVSAAASGGADITLTGKTKSLSISSSGGSDADIRGLTYETISSNKSGGGDINNSNTTEQVPQVER
ncbi:MAG: GIN domain-containing protein [Dysgonomonas sp.]